MTTPRRRQKSAIPERVFNKGRRSGEGEVLVAVLARRHKSGRERSVARRQEATFASKGRQQRFSGYAREAVLLCCRRRQLQLGLLLAVARAWNFRRRLGFDFFPLSLSLSLWVFTVGRKYFFLIWYRLIFFLT